MGIILQTILSNWQYTSIGLDNGLVPIRWQTIIWADDGLVYWRIYASLDLDELPRSVLR